MLGKFIHSSKFELPLPERSLPCLGYLFQLIVLQRVATEVELNDRKSGLVGQVAFVAMPAAGVGYVAVAQQLRVGTG